MKKIAKAAERIVERLALLNATEPVVVRGGLAAVLNFLVVSGVVSVDVAPAIQAVVLGALSLALVLSTRQNVVPALVAAAAHLEAYLQGHRHADEIAQTIASSPSATDIFPVDPAAPEPAQLTHTE